MRAWRHPIKADGSIKDHTVPYPSAAIDLDDHFQDWEDRGLEVKADEVGIVQSWEVIEIQPGIKRTKKPWWRKIGPLPPALRYRFPLNYVRQKLESTSDT